MLNIAHQYQQWTGWHKQLPTASGRGQNTEWETITGLEIHAQLSTKSKNLVHPLRISEPNTQASLIDWECRVYCLS